jgi:predicted Zn-dependent peptidase
MSVRRPLSLIVLLLAAVAGSGLVLSARQTPGQPPSTAPLSDRIPNDPAVRTGRFTNGLTYYVKHNAKPADRAELRLVVNAGSILEDEDQRGLAHFVEHMAFNGTKNFPKNEIVSFIESIGMRFGADLNASTSFDETIYMLQVPTDKPAVLDRAMLVLEDWAHNVSFDPKEIDKERGVVMEEWRLRRGAGARLQEKQFPVLLAGSRYVTRLPIGTTDVIQHAKPDRLIQFYKDWYRPDLMAVIAVGDFDTAAMEARIRTRFEPIPAARRPKPRPAYGVPARTSPATVIASDPEVPLTQVGVYNLMPTRDQSTIGDYRRQIVEGLFASMLSARFSEIAQKPDAPFLGASAGRGSIVRTAEGSVLSAAVKDNGVDRGLEALFVEADRVAKFGFTATELDRQKTAMARRLERAVIEKDNQESADLAAEYGRNFLEGEPMPGIVYENDLYKRFLPEITLEELNALARTWSPDRSRVVMVSAPEKPGVTLPTDAQLQAVIAGAAGKATTAYAARRDAPNAGHHREDDDARGEWDHGVDAVERRDRRAEADDVQAGRDRLPRVPLRRIVARKRRGLHLGEHGRTGRGQWRPRLDEHDRSAEGAERRDRLGVAVDLVVRGKSGRRRVAQGPRDAVPADLRALHGAARRRGDLQRHARPDEGRAGQPGRAAGVRLQQSADLGALRRSSAHAADDAGDGRSDEPRHVDGVLQGALRRRERVHVRLRRQLRSGGDAAARGAVPREPAVDRQP